MATFINLPKQTPYSKLLKEDNSFLLLENGDNIILDQEISVFTNLEKH